MKLTKELIGKTLTRPGWELANIYCTLIAMTDNHVAICQLSDKSWDIFDTRFEDWELYIPPSMVVSAPGIITGLVETNDVIQLTARLIRRVEWERFPVKDRLGPVSDIDIRTIWADLCRMSTSKNPILMTFKSALN